jgi:Fur family ferric uptake transcriptional regulator
MRSDLNTSSAASPRVARALARCARLARSRGLRWTGERAAIVRAIASEQGHFSADELIRSLKRGGLSASRATLYRAIPLLVEAGILQPALRSGEERRYEVAWGHAHHDHLVCKQCGRVVEFRFEAFEMLQRDVAEKYGFELLGHFHELIGICRECREGAPRKAATRSHETVRAEAP